MAFKRMESAPQSESDLSLDTCHYSNVRTLAALSIEPSIDPLKTPAALAQKSEIGPNTDCESQSPKEIEASAFTEETSPVSKLFSNYPPCRSLNRHKRHCNHSTCLSCSSSNTPSSSPNMRPLLPLIHDQKSAGGDSLPDHPGKWRFTIDNHVDTSARQFSSNFPEGHQLQSQFVEAYQLQDELGSGGYGFVMTALDRYDGFEVAVKFIIKDKVPEHSWINDPTFGRLPMEVVILSFVNHESVVKCLDVFEDSIYFYLVQELHGSPWNRSQGYTLDWSPMASINSTPCLSPSTSETSLVPDSPRTPPHSMFSPLPDADVPALSQDEVYPQTTQKHEICKRPSYDLFECIEQSERKRLTEEQARYVFRQVVDAVAYLDALGICHRDIKDENVVIDHNLKIKLIDFGSSTIVDPSKERPVYDLFYGTAAYASSEILLKRKYRAAPAEVWTLGVLLSYLLAGVSPFPTIRDAVDGRIYLSETLGLKPSESAMSLIRGCLDPNPETRMTVAEIAQHPWMHEELTPVGI